MLVAIDTSVLVAATLGALPSHPRAKCWLDAVESGGIEAMVCAHALAELYNVLTRIPGKLTPGNAEIVVKKLSSHVRVVPLTVGDYVTAISRCSERGIASGGVFDALHVIAAEQHRADIVLTFNPGDFNRLANGERPRVVVPPDPPAVEGLE